MTNSKYNVIIDFIKKASPQKIQASWPLLRLSKAQNGNILLHTGGPYLDNFVDNAFIKRIEEIEKASSGTLAISFYRKLITKTNYLGFPSTSAPRISRHYLDKLILYGDDGFNDPINRYYCLLDTGRYLYFYIFRAWDTYYNFPSKIYELVAHRYPVKKIRSVMNKINIWHKEPDIEARIDSFVKEQDMKHLIKQL